MLGASPVIAFVPSTDLERSRRFYEQVAGLRVTDITPFACVLRAGETMVRITKVDGLAPQPFTVLGWIVPEIGRAGMSQDDDGVWTTPGGDMVAWFTDPDGNTLSLTQFGRPSG